MKIKCVIANYGEYQWKYCEELLDQYINKSKYDFNITIVSTSEHDISKYNGLVTEVLEPASLGERFPFACQKYLTSTIGQYDYYMYFENDTVIPDITLDTFFKYDKILPDHSVLGLILVEKYEDGQLNIVGNSSTLNIWPDPVIGTEMIGGIKYFTLHNKHHTGYLLSQNDILYVKDNPKYTSELPYSGLQEGACTNVYDKCGIKQFTPVNDVGDSLIYHLTLVYKRQKVKYTLEDLNKRIRK